MLFAGTFARSVTIMRTVPPRTTHRQLGTYFELPSLDGKNLQALRPARQAVLLTSGRPIAVLQDRDAVVCRAAERIRAARIQIVGVAMDDASLEDIAKIRKEMGVNYPICSARNPLGRATAVSTCCPPLSS